MIVASVTETKASFNEFFERCIDHHEVVVVTRYGKPVALLIAMNDHERLNQYVGTASLLFRRLVVEAVEAHRQGRSISAADFWERISRESGQKQSDAP